MILDMYLACITRQKMKKLRGVSRNGMTHEQLKKAKHYIMCSLITLKKNKVNAFYMQYKTHTSIWATVNLGIGLFV